jgi:hypothetical protein
MADTQTPDRIQFKSLEARNPVAERRAKREAQANLITKHEIVCITRSGFHFLHTEGADFAAQVTYHKAGDVLQERLIPLIGWWG